MRRHPPQYIEVLDAIAKALPCSLGQDTAAPNIFIRGFARVDALVAEYVEHLGDGYLLVLVEVYLRVEDIISNEYKLNVKYHHDFISSFLNSFPAGGPIPIREKHIPKFELVSHALILVSVNRANRVQIIFCISAEIIFRTKYIFGKRQNENKNIQVSYPEEECKKKHSRGVLYLVSQRYLDLCEYG